MHVKSHAQWSMKHSWCGDLRKTPLLWYFGQKMQNLAKEISNADWKPVYKTGPVSMSYKTTRDQAPPQLKKTRDMILEWTLGQRGKCYKGHCWSISWNLDLDWGLDNNNVISWTDNSWCVREWMSFSPLRKYMLKYLGNDATYSQMVWGKACVSRDRRWQHKMLTIANSWWVWVKDIWELLYYFHNSSDSLKLFQN